MKPGGGGQTTGTLRERIESDFSSDDAFVDQSKAAAEWGLLGSQPDRQRIESA